MALTQTRFGRYVYAIGGNENVTRLSGVNVTLIKIVVYAVSGLLAALANRSHRAPRERAANRGRGLELDAIAAVVVGGTSLAGGIGSIQATLIGALIIGILNNALNFMDVSADYQMIAKGAVILLAVLVDRRETSSPKLAVNAPRVPKRRFAMIRNMFHVIVVAALSCAAAGAARAADRSPLSSRR